MEKQGWVHSSETCIATHRGWRYTPDEADRDAVMTLESTSVLGVALGHFLHKPICKSLPTSVDFVVVRFLRLSDYVDHAVRHVMMRQGVLGVTVSIMLPHDPTVRAAWYRMLTSSRHASMRVTACCRGSLRLCFRIVATLQSKLYRKN